MGAPGDGGWFPPDFDNPNFFTVHYHRGMRWYEQTYFSGVMGQKAIGEFSNSYSVFVPALQRVARDLEDVRLTFTLRNPIERCYISWAGAHIRERYGFDLLCAEIRQVYRDDISRLQELIGRDLSHRT